jgi:hypothetical protein
LTEPKSRLALLDTVVVCPGAFDAFVMEKNLHDQEKIFAKTIMNMSVPALSERYGSTSIMYIPYRSVNLSMMVVVF